MDDWVTLEEGEYYVEQAFVVAPNGSALALSEPYVEVFLDPAGRRRLVIRALAFSLQLVELMEDSDSLDVLLDLGSRFTYLLKTPFISGGKIFSPGVRSAVQITPASRWEAIPRNTFETRIADLQLLEGDPRV